MYWLDYSTFIVKKEDQDKYIVLAFCPECKAFLKPEKIDDDLIFEHEDHDFGLIILAKDRSFTQITDLEKAERLAHEYIDELWREGEDDKKDIEAIKEMIRELYEDVVVDGSEKLQSLYESLAFPKEAEVLEKEVRLYYPDHTITIKKLNSRVIKIDVDNMLKCVVRIKGDQFKVVSVNGKRVHNKAFINLSGNKIPLEEYLLRILGLGAVKVMFAFFL